MGAGTARDTFSQAGLGQAETRSRLLAAAAEVFAEAGLAGASVERIIERAGYTRGAFYGHFGDKNALVVAFLGGTDPPRT
ncbi:hypothetical protein AD006_30645 (plasmid) [Pseudonocardia sp. EC080610-09]|uniref:TetR/AcrR family transcriptional regulator n=1 Tax=unclassified Pseudonocardia TaxID=2619320 RepID=UPI0007060904|nr:hypothetical protein AD006_30645 [Pseudonocardia sp. EC080610-09]ALL85479.1 hypothetical protein AD017_30595 [Pseudonocardia sp. EC080619-01]